MRSLLSLSDLCVGALLFYRSGKARDCGGESLIADRADSFPTLKVSRRMSEFAALPTPAPLAVACAASPAFQDWMANAGGALAVSTYQAGKVALIGWDGQQVTLLMREFDKPLGLGVSGDRLVLATRHDVWVFANAPLARSRLFGEPTGPVRRLVPAAGDLSHRRSARARRGPAGR